MVEAQKVATLVFVVFCGCPVDNLFPPTIGALEALVLPISFPIFCFMTGCPSGVLNVAFYFDVDCFQGFLCDLLLTNGYNFFVIFLHRYI